MPRVRFGAWTPDLAPMLTSSTAVTVARNVVPKAGGYAPQPGLSPIAGATALDARPRGTLSGTRRSGAFFHLAGDRTKLYQLRDAGMVNVSRLAGYDCGETERWASAIYGGVAIFANYRNPTQYRNLAASPSTAFGDVDMLEQGAWCPRARHATVSNNFLVLGNLFDRTLGNAPDAIAWSAIGNPLGWPEPGTDDAAAVQSGRQPLRGGGGWVQGLCAGSEVLAIFQEHAIWRGDYRGGREVWQLDRVEDTNGLLVPGGTACFDRMIFYIAEDGFRVFNYTSSESVGKDLVNRTFLADLNTSYLDRVTVLRNPDATQIWVSYPSNSSSSGMPDKAIVWDYKLNQFSELELDCEGLSIAATAPPSLDSPDDPPLDPIELEGVTTSLDTRPSAPGTFALGAYSTGRVLSHFAGENLVGVIETGDVEAAPGRRFKVSSVRPLVDGEDPLVAVAGLDRRGVKSEDVTFGPDRAMGRDGAVPANIDARYHRFRCTLPLQFTEATGLDVMGRPTGSR